MSYTTKQADRDSLTVESPLGTKIGYVTSDGRDKSRKVEVFYMVKHPKYGKYLKRSQKFQVHDQDNVSKNGDKVEIARCRPVSKTKAWRIVQVVEAAPEPISAVAEVPEATGETQESQD